MISQLHISWSSSPHCLQWKGYLCKCLSLHCHRFLLISLKSYVFCHVLLSWLLAYGCCLFSPSPFLLYLHVVPPVPPHLPPQPALSSPCVLRHCAQRWTCSSWLVSLLSFLCLFFVLYICPCSMHGFSLALWILLSLAALLWNVNSLLTVIYW